MSLEPLLECGDEEWQAAPRGSTRACLGHPLDVSAQLGWLGKATPGWLVLGHLGFSLLLPSCLHRTGK